jgi:hypothetical protein
VTFRPDSLRQGGDAAGRLGVIDHRLARRSVISEFRKGRLARHQVCDAHPELVRAARSVGQPTTMECPICEDASLVLLTYVFGPRLPPFGRCVSSHKELAQLGARRDQLTAYLVEVCPDCSWHHLLRTAPLGGRR